MKIMRLTSAIITLSVCSCSPAQDTDAIELAKQYTTTNRKKKDTSMSDDQTKSKKEFLKNLSPFQYQVTQCSATEPAFDNEYWNNHKKGEYKCVVCGNELFSSDTKYDSGTGWPSFYKTISDSSVKTRSDSALWMKRTEVVCNKCGAHLGHLFDDGPKPTGMRFCINSASLTFEKEGEKRNESK